ncbi:amidase [Caulobacter segnis]|uniref:Amidase n=1 Tax=Caulobacter segnis TaxID=88688 RepID=A0A2W5VBS9_9CAUL|nr:amidase [Caulobacter segnis]PZR32835.1 MAG: amidase [Caulobacter segnis]
MTQDPFELTATQMLRAYAGRQLSPVVVMASVLERVDKVNPALNALVFIDPEAALAEARASEARWAQGRPKGLLDGVPITIKDSIAEASRPMLRGLKANAGGKPSGYDAPPTARVKEAGAIVFAKTTMPDFGLLASGVSSAYGVTRNPWNLAFNPGGSSSGASASIAARCGPLAVGSDIGGSVRIPAGLCGLVGFKPTQGRIPHLPPSPVRSAGPITRTVADNALLLTALAEPDRRDYGSLPPDPTRYHERLDRDLKGVRIGLILEGDSGQPPEPAVAEAIERAAAQFAAAGAHVARLPSVVGADFMEIVGVLFLIRGYNEFSRLPQAAKAFVPDHFSAWFDKIGGYSAIDVGASMDRLEATKARVLGQMAEYDYLISPVSAFSAFPAEALQASKPGEPNTLYTPVWNQTGNPAISVNCGFDPGNGMPIGLQIVGHHYDDLGVLQMAAAYERLRDFETAWPD